MASVLDLQQTDDPRDIVHRAVQALVEGQVVGIPTEATYVLAADALNVQAVARLFELTNASPTNPGVLSLRSLDAAQDYLCSSSRLAGRLSRRCWPGPLSMIVECDRQKSAARRLPEGVQEKLFSQPGSGQGNIGFRVVDHRVLSHVHRFLAAPLVLVEARNDSESAPIVAEGVEKSILKQIPLLLDDGPTRYGGRTTFVRISGDRWELQHEGVIEQAAMKQFVKPVIALVCTGNTCRSPMAETILRELLSKKFNCEDAVRVLSAGVAAGHGSGASPQAVEVMGRQCLDLTGHSSRPFDESVVQVADLVLTMTRGHRAAILAAYPDMHDRVFTLRRDGGDISDPVGMPVEVYQACAEQIEAELQQWIEALDDGFFPASGELCDDAELSDDDTPDTNGI